MRTVAILATFADLGNQTFSDWLLALGEGRLETVYDDCIRCPRNMLPPQQSIKELIDAIYPGIARGGSGRVSFSSCAIFCGPN